jgi:Cys-tRNA(Pro)/Cys-tRNA(Cys) deacylase
MLSLEKTALQEKMTELAQKLDIAFKILPHSKNGVNTRDVAHALGEDPKRILKSLVLEDLRNHTTVMAVIRGDSKLSMGQIKEVTNCKKLVLAKPERVFEISGFYVGGVPPFAMLSCEYRLVCDSVLDLSYVIGAGGHPYLGIEICTTDLLKIPGIKVSRISQNLLE